MEKQRLTGLMLLLVSLGVLAVVAVLLPEKGGLAVDRYAEELAAEMKSSEVTAMSRLLAYAGSTVGVIGITLLSALGIGCKSGWRNGWIIIAGVAAAYGSNLLLKALFNRSRPELAWGIEVSGASFPSAHATLGCAMFGLIAMMLLRAFPFGKVGRFLITTGAIILILLMGASRIYFHVHYLTDIIAGIASGLMVIAVVMLLTKPVMQQSSKGDKAYAQL